MAKTPPLRNPEGRAMSASEFKLAIEALLRKGFIVGEFDETIQNYRFRPTDKREGRAA